MSLHHKQVPNTFRSDLSGNSYPLTTRIAAKFIRPTMLEFIRKDYPLFSQNHYLALEELNAYRERYITECLKKEMGQLSVLETTVLNSLTDTNTIANLDDPQPLSIGQRIADKVASFGGSWRFIILFGLFLVVWILLNAWLWGNQGFDPYPFILLNLLLSCLAAIQAPVIMMSQNRQEEKDRERAKKDYMVNLKSELEIRILHEKIDHLIMHQQQELLEIQQIQIEMMHDILKRLDK